MDINAITGYSGVTSYANNQVKTEKVKAEVAESKETDSFTKSISSDATAGTYSPESLAKTTGKEAAAKMAEKLEENDTGKRYSYDKATVDKLIAESNSKISAFKEMLQTLLAKQADRNGGVISSEKTGMEALLENATVGEDGMVHFNREDVEAAGLGEFDENGYWGVEQTAQRIFDMAIAFAGNDENLLAKMKDSISQAFGEVEDLFGGEGKLPDVSYRTRDRINEMFEEYENGGTATEEVVTE